MTDGVFLKTIGHYQVTVNSCNGFFVARKAEDDKNHLEAKTLSELEELIKRQVSDERHFKPIDVIQVEAVRIGRITSRVADRDAEVYFTFKDAPDQKKPTRIAAYLENTRWGDNVEYRFVKTTPENLKIKAEIDRVEMVQHRLEKRVEALKKTFKDPVTWAVIDGEKPPVADAKKGEAQSCMKDIQTWGGV